MTVLGFDGGFVKVLQSRSATVRASSSLPAFTTTLKLLTHMSSLNLEALKKWASLKLFFSSLNSAFKMPFLIGITTVRWLVQWVASTC